MSYCTNHISRKIRILSFVAMVVVVLIHTDPIDLFVSPTDVMHWMSRFKGSLQLWAVPYFFMVSGFFFERELSTASQFDYFGFLRRKLRSLGIPYLLWGGVYGTLLSLPLAVAVNISQGESIFQRTPLLFWPDLVKIVDHVFGISCSAPANGALWFVRMLLLFFVFAPAWNLLLRHARMLIPALGMLLALCCNTSGAVHDMIAFPFGLSFAFKFSAVGYLLLGMSVGLFRLEERAIPPACAVGLVLFCLVYAALGLDCNVYLHRFFILVSVAAVWSAYDIVAGFAPSDSPSVIGFSFWVYCMHHLLTCYLGAALRVVVGRHGVGSYLLQVILVPILTIVFSLMVATWVKKHMPRLFAILNGGR